MRRWLLALLAIGAIAGAVWALQVRASAQSRRTQPAGAAGSDAQERPVPVLVARVEQRDVPIYLEGLGTVAAYNTVIVRSRVDGRLDRVLFVEGQTVHRGDVLAEIDAEPFRIQLRQAEAAAARDRAQLLVNRRTLERATMLRDQHFIAPQEYDIAQGAVGQAQATVRLDEAQIAAARVSLGYTRVTSPIDGVTGLRQVDAGNMIHANDVNGIVLVRQIDPIAVLFTLPQDDLPRIAEQMALGPLAVEVSSRDGSTPLATGQLTVVDNQINQTTSTLRLKAVFPNPQRRLWPDQFVRTRLLLATRRGALVVPAESIQRGPQGTFVYRVGADQRVEIRTVRVDRIEAELALIAQGLAAGDQVVTEGQNRLRAGARVQPRPATAANADGAASQGSPEGAAAGDGGAAPGRRRRRDASAPP